jgi:hypothetical protein
MRHISEKDMQLARCMAAKAALVVAINKFVQRNPEHIEWARSVYNLADMAALSVEEKDLVVGEPQ